MQTGETLILAFIDLKAGFDTIQRHVMKKCLKQREDPKNLIQIINSKYNEVRARIQLNGERSNTQLCVSY